MKTLQELCLQHTTVIMAYEERKTGNKPMIEQKFFQVSDARNCTM